VAAQDDLVAASAVAAEAAKADLIAKALRTVLEKSAETRLGITLVRKRRLDC
jgi:hypothetical protein